MFPGYLFARFDYATFHQRVRHGRGIRGFVQFGDHFGLLPNELIDQLKARVGENEVVEISQTFVPGQHVQISQGPFQGLEALVTRSIAARDRVEILIEWMRGGALEIVKDHETGLLVEPADSHALAGAIHELLENTQLAATLGKSAKRDVEERFGLEEVLHQWKQCIREVTLPRQRYAWQSSTIT
jgi:glycosyltransferase involved in cell wall biosynthesis